MPYLFDSWTVSQTPIAVYETNDNNVFQIPVTLEQFQSRFVAFIQSDFAPDHHVLSHSENIVEVRVAPSGGLKAYVADTKAAEVILSDRNKTVVIPEAPEPLPTVPELGPWKLTIESHGPASNDSVESAVETIDGGMLQELVPWTQIPQLAQVSGVGTYETTFDFAAGTEGNTTADGIALRLSFGPVRNTIRAWVNERQLPPLDLTDAVADVTEYLISGRNSLRVEVTSSLFNAVKSRGPEALRSASLGPRNPDLITEPDFDEFGLIRPVSGQVLRIVTVL